MEKTAQGRSAVFEMALKNENNQKEMTPSLTAAFCSERGFLTFFCSVPSISGRSGFFSEKCNTKKRCNSSLIRATHDANLSDQLRQNVPKWRQNVPKWRQNVPKWRTTVQFIAHTSDARRQSERPVAPKWAEMPKSKRVISRAERAIGRSA